MKTADIIYNLMLRAQRRRIHSQIAAWYERVRNLQRRRMGWGDSSGFEQDLIG